MNDVFWDQVDTYEQLVAPFLAALQTVHSGGVPASRWRSVIDAVVEQVNGLARLPDGITTGEVARVLASVQQAGVGAPFGITDLLALLDPGVPLPADTRGALRNVTAFFSARLAEGLLDSKAILTAFNTWVTNRDYISRACSWVQGDASLIEWWQHWMTDASTAALKPFALDLLLGPLTASVGTDMFANTRACNGAVLVATTGSVTVEGVCALARLKSYFVNTMGEGAGGLSLKPWYLSHLWDRTSRGVDETVAEFGELDVDHDAGACVWTEPAVVPPVDAGFKQEGGQGQGMGDAVLDSPDLHGATASL